MVPCFKKNKQTLNFADDYIVEMAYNNKFTNIFSANRQEDT